ncbi:isochorismatase family protein [Thiovibrio frasassiensis]|uniref:Isochorismatase family protein n=1 Tax=Thiovibrio frasassiensis TaxID=2984131 RepID=A0A9X4MFR7_9BACT|nr:isochorismatase family protein [Thiovibrio frasassiensis]MDG4474718.1 isochorismatase family protein [Thiovibrio frasassiensis]
MRETLYRLAPEQCALLVVDIQERMMQAIPARDEVVKNAALLMKAANILGVPILATTQYAARIGALLPEIQAELAGVIPLDKLEFGCFANGPIGAAAKRLPKEINTIVVCGVETHICIYQTVAGGLLQGYRMWVPADGVASRVEKNYATGLARISEIGGIVANTEMIIYEWLQKAGTPAFKAILPFIK